MNGWRKILGYWILFSAVYFCFAMLSLETRNPWSLSSSIWLPSGLVLGVFCISPRVYWPLWGISAGMLHITASLFYARSLDVSLTFALLDLFLVVPLAIIWRNTNLYFRYSVRSEMFLLIIGIYIISVTGGVLSTLILQILNYPVLLSHFSTWTLANATGCLSSAPFFIFHRTRIDHTRILKHYHCIVLFMVSTLLLLSPELISTDLLRWTILYLVLVGSLVLSASCSLKILSMYFLYLTLLVSLSTISGHGPLATSNDQVIENSQLYLLAVISLGLLLAARERDSAITIETQAQQLSTLFQLTGKHRPVLFRFYYDTGSFHWSGDSTVFGISPHAIPTLVLLLARIHPEDQDEFSVNISTNLCASNTLERKSFRLLLSDCRYHTIHYSSVPSLSGSESIGALVLNT